MTDTTNIVPEWKNRIVSSGTMPADQFLAHERNWRKHPPVQQMAIKSVLDKVGWVQSVVVSARSGKVLDGHMRVEAALTHGDQTLVPYIEVDLTEEEENLILATLDPISAMAITDESLLADLLNGFESEDQDLLATLSVISATNHIDLNALVDADPFANRLFGPTGQLSSGFNQQPAPGEQPAGQFDYTGYQYKPPGNEQLAGTNQPAAGYEPNRAVLPGENPYNSPTNEFDVRTVDPIEDSELGVAGTLLSLVNLEIAEPQYQVAHGDVIRLEEHILICADVINEWNRYIEYLTGDALFCPHPSPFITATETALSRRLILVQPDPYIAGHLVDRWIDLNGVNGVEVIHHD